MALPTPTINLDELLVGSRNPALDVGIREGSRIALMPRAPAVTPYSPENLPEFMAGFEQVTPTTFAPVIGGTTTAGMTPEELALYQQREQAFRESFAIDPTMFGGGYRPSQFTVLPPPAAPVEEEPFDVATAIAAADVLSDLLPESAPDIDLGEIKIDATAPDLGLDIQAPAGELALPDVSIPDIPIPEIPIPDISLELGDLVPSDGLPSIDIPSIDLPSVDVPRIDAGPITGAISAVAEAGGEWFEQNVTDPVTDFAEENIIDPITDFVKDITPDFIEDLPASDIIDTVGSAENFAENPTYAAAEDLINATNQIAFDMGYEGAIVPASVGDTMKDVGSVASIAAAFEDPTAKNLTNAYQGADHLTRQFTDIKGLPFGDEIPVVGDLLTGLEALEGGIDSVGEAVQVGNAAATVGALLGNQAMATAAGFLGPAAGLIAVAGLLDRKGTKMGHGFIQRDDAGNYSVKSHDTKEGGYQVIIPEIHVAGTVMRDLEDAYGYEFDEAAWDSLDKKIDFDAKNPKNFRGAYDIVVEALQTGALKETDATPEAIDWESLFVDARENVDSKLPVDKKRLQDPYFLDTSNYYLSQKRLEESAMAALEGLPELFATTPFDLYGTGVTPAPPPSLSEQELADLGLPKDFTLDLDFSDLGRFSLF